MLYLVSEPMPDDYLIYVIQVMSIAYDDWVDYRRLPFATDAVRASRILADHVLLHQNREFRLVLRQIRDAVVS